MQARPWKTKNDRPEEVRSRMIELLNQHLADAIDLASQAKQAHWNVKGPSFIALHELFDDIVDQVGEHVDELAERAVALGGTAFGTVRSAARRSLLAEYPLEASSGQAHVAALSSALASLGKAARAAIDTSAASGDADTADLFTALSRALDKLLWKVEVHAQGED
jgi:starvation-inducible DNA-binding protein